MSVSEQLFLPFTDLDIDENASKNDDPIYLNAVLALSDKVRHVSTAFDFHRTESEKRHADRRYRMLVMASDYYEQGLFAGAITELQAIINDLEIAQDTFYTADISAVIDHCRLQCRRNIEPIVAVIALNEAAS